MTTYIVKNVDGSVRISRTIANSAGLFPDFVKDVLPEWTPEERATVVSFREIPEAEVPTDRYFRDAWTDTGTAITVDMVKAREIQKEVLRVASITDPIRDTRSDPEIAAATTPEELRAITTQETR